MNLFIHFLIFNMTRLTANNTTSSILINMSVAQTKFWLASPFHVAATLRYKREVCLNRFNHRSKELCSQEVCVCMYIYIWKLVWATMASSRGYWSLTCGFFLAFWNQRGKIWLRNWGQLIWQQFIVIFDSKREHNLWNECNVLNMTYTKALSPWTPQQR